MKTRKRNSNTSHPLSTTIKQTKQAKTFKLLVFVQNLIYICASLNISDIIYLHNICLGKKV